MKKLKANLYELSGNSTTNSIVFVAREHNSVSWIFLYFRYAISYFNFPLDLALTCTYGLWLLRKAQSKEARFLEGLFFHLCIFKNYSSKQALPPLQSNFFVEHGGRGDSSSLPEPFIKLTCSHSRGTINPLTSYPPPAPSWRSFILAKRKGRKCQHDRN